MATPIQHIRVAQPLWDAAMRRAEREGRRLPEVLRVLIAAYVRGGLVVDLEGRIAIRHLEEGDGDGEGTRPPSSVG